jgi:hypothetical protein
MTPDKSHCRLALSAALVAFVLAGAPLQADINSGEHWAFQPLVQVSPPRPDLHPIDGFIVRGLEDARLSLSPRADRTSLIRRLFFDLHGLPPSPESVVGFLADSDPQAASRLIDQLLESPRYGERWAQHWLDLVRYADTHGFEVNTERANAWPYRDYVIRAFNDDRPYNQFILEQLAGDSAGEDAATGFLVASAVLLPGQIGKDDASKRLARQDSLNEIIVATGDTFLGVSIGCARCHDHKFDPISQRDYYTMQAFFAGVEYGERPLRNPRIEAKVAAHARKIATIRKRLDKIAPSALTTRTILIDDEDANRTTHLKKKNGHGTNPAGSGRGYRDDPGGTDRIPNLSGSRYTWWDSKSGEDVFTYNPSTAGRFRIWISWGVHGSGVHTRDARYVLDQDGNLQTREDQVEIARADQHYFVGVSEGVTEKKPLWSGLHDAGLHELRKESRLILRAGETGTGITADVILLQDDIGQGPHPGLRAPVNPARNVERFAPIQAKFIRFTSLATIENNKHEPCIDELEIFAASGENNVALGGTPTSSGNRPGDPQHQLKQINDGHYGNGKSWISNQAGRGWVQIELPEITVIDRIVWGRDRDGKFKDRLAHHYQIEVALEPGQWRTVASSDDRVPYGTPFDATAALLRKLAPDAADSIRTDLAELGTLEKELAALVSRQNVYAGKFRAPDATYLLNRGDPEQQGERVDPAIPAALGNLSLDPKSAEQERRVALARWIGSESNPLTARVLVNRIWQYHFGRGLVDTASDFGRNGTKPSHPELLDWLAIEFIRGGWSIKKLHRLILNSATYQQSSRYLGNAAAIDDQSRLLWRFPPRRLEAEAIRDGMLAVSGTLNLKMGGPGFNFFKSRGGLSGFPIVDSFRDDGLRRMIYAHKVRMERAPVFGAFDCPDAGQATPRRSRAITATQALNLFNSKFVIDQSAAFAARVRSEVGGEDQGARITRAFQLAFGRNPTASERASAAGAVNEHGLATLCRALFNSNEFIFMP